MGRTTDGHQIASREEWLAARLPLLEQEKELTRRSDELARQRAALPWVAVEKTRVLIKLRCGSGVLDSCCP
jgi:predicted dithiol-disulfide oxidoreductase (DUF899 family)